MTRATPTSAGTTSPYDIGLDRNPANHQPLTPLDLPGARGGDLS